MRRVWIKDGIMECVFSLMFMIGFILVAVPLMAPSLTEQFQWILIKIGSGITMIGTLG